MDKKKKKILTIYYSVDFKIIPIIKIKPLKNNKNDKFVNKFGFDSQYPNKNNRSNKKT
jgi:hypothetical protein